MAIYVEWDGIKGDVTAEGYKDQIEVNSLQFGVGRGITSPSGGSKDRESSAPQISEITVSKPMDKATPNLFEAACMGTGKTVKLHFAMTAPGSGTLSDFLSYELSDVLLAGYSVSSPGGNQPRESLTLNFTKIIMKYIPGGADNTAEPPLPFGWNLATQKKV